ncbi:hypothetical protein P9869_38545 [Streptomyces ossamyceticus]|nr:hypothetical protein [Streptomyces ossamyceticus]
MASPPESSSDADCTHRSTAPGSTPSARQLSTRVDHGSARPYGVRSPQGRSMRSGDDSMAASRRRITAGTTG